MFTYINNTINRVFKSKLKGIYVNFMSLLNSFNFNNSYKFNKGVKGDI